MPLLDGSLDSISSATRELQALGGRWGHIRVRGGRGGRAVRQRAGPARYYLAMVAARCRLALAASTSLRLHDSPPVHSLLHLPSLFFTHQDAGRLFNFSA